MKVLESWVLVLCRLAIFKLMNTPVMVELEGETDPLEVVTHCRETSRALKSRNTWTYVLFILILLILL
ncbi:putative RNA polymerase subunit, RPB6/omega [Rosa chinensis]|uniref:Putative RNA polymerase subunit, RPB6/omega n=1 Tax=Rosa chinensis TaxID=74649 RepID=A0A2P6PGE8_ROSCH|nr:putative RNA polymerase subunit, RPB6/omega [Rosa chinensis]